MRKIKRSAKTLLVYSLMLALFITSAGIASLAEEVSPAPIQNLTINGNPIEEYVIILPSVAQETEFRPYVQGDQSRSLSVELGTQLKQLMKTVTGCELMIGYDSPEGAASAGGNPEKVLWFRFNEQLEGGEFLTTIKDGVVTIEGGIGAGLWYGMYDFMETYLGIRFISQDNVYIPESDGLNITDGSYGEAPVFEFREISSFYSNSDTITNNLARRLNSGSSDKFFMNYMKYGASVGTTWYNAHSFQYQLPEGVQGSTWDTQPCLSKEETYESVRDSVLSLIGEREKNGIAGLMDEGFVIGVTMTIITVAWNDNLNYCKCDECIAATTGERNLSDQYIDFVNRVADDVKAQFPGMKVLALAYGNTSTPPTQAIPRDNVVVMFCSAGCNNHGLAHSEDCSEQGNAFPGGGLTSRKDKANLEKWLEISDSVYFWGYYDGFGNFLAQSPIYSYVKDEIRWLADAGVKGIYSEGRSNPGAQYCFEGMREYLITQLMWNPYMSDEEYEALAKEYMAIYYGEAAAPYIFEYMLMWDKGGKLNNCWVNNFDGIKAIHNLDYYGDNYEAMTKLFDSAEAVSSGEQLTRIQKLRLTMEFLCLTGLYYDSYVNGTQEQKDWYIERYTALHAGLHAFGMIIMDDFNYLSTLEDNSAFTSGEGTELNYCPLTWYRNRDGFHDLDPRYYTVEFHANGGSEVSPQTVYNFYCRQPEETTREGYSFAGWYQDPEFGGEAHIFGYNYTSESKIARGDCDENGVFHLYAKWEANAAE